MQYTSLGETVDYNHNPNMSWLTPQLQQRFKILQELREADDRKLVMEKIAGLRRSQQWK